VNTSQIFLAGSRKRKILNQSTLSPLNMYSTSISSILKKGQLPEDYAPSDTDILCGRGRAYLEHSGNKTFSETVRANLQRYIEAPKKCGRTSVVASVAHSLKDSGVRFIKQDKLSNLYCELSVHQAHNKIGHAIRDLLKNDTRSAGWKIEKKGSYVDTVSSRKRRNKAENSDFLDCLSDDDSNSNPEVNAQLILEVFDRNLLKNEKEQGGCVISSTVLAPLPLSSETWIELTDIRRVLDILDEDHTLDLEHHPTNASNESSDQRFQRI
jgi:hypothetical protein